MNLFPKISWKKFSSLKPLLTTIFDRTYEDCLVESRKSIGRESMLLINIDGWRNSSSNAKTVGYILHNANREQMFLDAWDVSTETEDGDSYLQMQEKQL